MNHVDDLLGYVAVLGIVAVAENADERQQQPAPEPFLDFGGDLDRVQFLVQGAASGCTRLSGMPVSCMTTSSRKTIRTATASTIRSDSPTATTLLSARSKRSARTSERPTIGAWKTAS
ncbi:hypothetical protein [Gordoniibacillus kamchatkensis]|uniref:hypothetical protein n=1 Tax=Gordoniibacillus kamchatkensis TaxID=1590651 RepID=UPI001E3F05BF|nr:hypothetical protein [Paenibacillus sp. VKM B-2647]